MELAVCPQETCFLPLNSSEVVLFRSDFDRMNRLSGREREGLEWGEDVCQEKYFQSNCGQIKHILSVSCLCGQKSLQKGIWGIKITSED